MKLLTALGLFVLFTASSASIIETIVDIVTFNAETDAYFWLYTQKNPNGQRITRDLLSIQNSTFNSTLPVRFIIHGFLYNKDSPEIVGVRKSYLRRGNFNVIVVDWGWGSITPDYELAKSRINSVAVVLAKLIDYLVANNLTTLPNVTIVGHSLGGQMAGLTGKKITGGKVGAIIALDPAAFDYNNVNGRVAPTDATYVEVIHTNAGLIGQSQPLGQADFYVNYGQNQPGCWFDFVGVCAHLRAVLYFSESLNSVNNFKALKCSSNYSQVLRGSCSSPVSGFVMGGEPSNSGLSGIFYVKTNSASPFGQG